MEPTLPLEVLGKIVERVKAGQADCGRIVNTANRAEQAELFNLLTVSKAFSHIAVLPSLYDDCLICPTSHWLHTLTTHLSYFNNTRRLRFTEPDVPCFAVYASILSGDEDWSLLDTRDSPTQQERKGWEVESRKHEQRELEEVVEFLGDQIEEGHRVFPALHQVAMGVSKNLSGQRLRHSIRHDVEWTLATYSQYSLPLFLLGHPPVKHFCQSNLLGTLSLPSGYIETSTQPDVVTHHMPPEHLNEFPDDPPAIVIGTVNRYYFPNSTLYCALPGDEKYALEREDVLPLFEPLVPMFERSRPRVFAEDGSSYKSQGGGQKKGWLKGTTVELYGFIRCYTLSRSEEYQYMIGMSDPTAAAAKAKPGSLHRVQKGLELLLPEWKGHVVLKNREDAPECTACGLDLNEQHRRTPEGGKWYVPN